MTLLVKQPFLRFFSRDTEVSNKSIDRFHRNGRTVAKVSEIWAGASAADRSDEEEGGVSVTHLESVQS